ncbi:hypothetical protein LXM63_12110 [Chryseobacterium gleum]|uniref:hypothetical protein n=1 Tax=Chryseobacterium gleum TaxID=250 RepID=UPI001E47DC91|nr:hypothetical protein [Chryseobacterium gleum]MCE4065841.1 hypothetical protein [Chryseobacterium gleum]
MKTKIVLLFLLGWVEMVCGQVKLLSEYESKYSDESSSKTLIGFIMKLEDKDKSNILKLINNQTGLGINDINQKIVEKKELKYRNIYLVDSQKIFVNLKNDSVFVIKGINGKTKYFLPRIPLFLDDSIQNIDDVIKFKLDSTFCSIKYRCTESSKGAHDGKAIHDSVFVDDLKTLKKAVILNSSDNVTSNSAIAFTSGNDTKLSIGANLSYHNHLFFNISAYTSSVNSGLFYSSKSWKKDVGGSLTLNIVTSSPTKFFNEKKCDELYKKRNNYYRDIIINDYNEFKNDEALNEDELILLLSDVKKIKNRLNNTKLEENERIEMYAKIERIQKRIAELKEKMRRYEKIVVNPYKYINDSIIAFDKRNIKVFNGSSLQWFRATVDVYNQNIDLDTSKVNKMIVIENQVSNYPRLNLNLSYNWNKQFGKYLLNLFDFQVFSNVIMGNLLDANVGIDKPNLEPILEQKNNDAFIVDNGGRKLGKYSYLSRAFWTLQSGLQFSIFMTNNFGFTVLGTHTFALQNMDYMEYRNRYALQGGLIFRINDEEDVNKATFRVMAGVDNEPYHTRALKNSFMVKVSIGIPFGLFIKSKKAK